MPTQRGADTDATVATAETAGEVDVAGAQADASRWLWHRLLAVIGIATVAWVVLLLAWDEAPFTLTFDDAYYYFGIARNLVEGHGSTFDQINLTNGYHPLWLGVSTIPFLAGLDDLAATRSLLVLQAVVGWGLSLVLVSRLVTDQIDGWALGRKASRGDPTAAARLRQGASWVIVVVVALVALNPFLAKVVVNGLETGISVPIDAALLLIACRRGGHWLGGSRASRWAVAVLLSAAFLARTDAILLIGCLGLWCLAELIGGRRAPVADAAADGDAGGGADGPQGAGGIAALAELFALPGAVIVGYLVVNQRLFGTPLQVSGLIKQAELTPLTVGVFAVFAVIAAAIGRHGFRRVHGPARRRAPRFPHTGAVALRTSWFGAFSVLLVGYYNVLQTQQWLWYYGPVLLYLVILFFLAVADITEASLRDRRPGAGPARTVGPVAAIFVVPLVLALVVTGRQFSEPTLRSIQIANRDAGVWIDANLPGDAVLASWDAGVVGYFSHRRVVNIDGVVNSLAFRDALREGTTASFLRCRGVAYVTNHGPDGGDPEIVALIGRMYGPDAEAGAVALYEEPFVYSGTTTGSAGTDSSGERTLVMYVYEVPADQIRPATDDDC